MFQWQQLNAIIRHFYPYNHSLFAKFVPFIHWVTFPFRWKLIHHPAITIRAIAATASSAYQWERSLFCNVKSTYCTTRVHWTWYEAGIKLLRVTLSLIVDSIYLSNCCGKETGSHHNDHHQLLLHNNNNNSLKYYPELYHILILRITLQINNTTIELHELQH